MFSLLVVREGEGKEEGGGDGRLKMGKGRGEGGLETGKGGREDDFRKVKGGGGELGN